MGNGWSVSTNYTVSKCINEAEPGQNLGSPFPIQLIDPFTNPQPDPSSNRGRCSTDRRHLFNLSSVILSPGLPVGGRFMNLLTKDWQIGLIFTARSGVADYGRAGRRQQPDRRDPARPDRAGCRSVSARKSTDAGPDWDCGVHRVVQSRRVHGEPDRHATAIRRGVI